MNVYRYRRYTGAAGGLPLLSLAAAAGKYLGKKAIRAAYGSKAVKTGREIITRPLGRAAGAAATVGTVAAGVRAVRGRKGAPGGVTLPAGVPWYPGMEDGFPRRRRMNYMNVKAARRAIRRIKGARKLLQSIERQLPKKTVRSKKGRK